MLREARSGDEPAIEAFLARHAETSMFLRGNLAAHGLFERDAPTGTRFWLAERGGSVTAVFGLTNAGFALGQAPDDPETGWRAFARLAAGQRLAGVTGENTQVVQAKAAFGLTDAAFTLDAPEPLYRLSLDRLGLPSGHTALRHPNEADRALLTTWHAAYIEELRMTTPDRRDTEAAQRAARAIEGGQTRLLVENGTPVAMTAFNARLPDMVQIGGVYTPPEIRGRGHARRAVALHLEEARAEGVKAAILFASGPAACRAYEAIGFEHIGEYTLAILKEPVVIGATP